MNADKSYKITLSAVGATISLLFVILAFWIKNLSLSFNILASLGLMMPLSQKFYRETILAYIAVSIVGSFFVNVNILSFVFLGGLFPIIAICIKDFKLKKSQKYLIFLLFSVISFFICYQVFKAIFFDIKDVIALDNPFLFYLIANIIYFIALILYDLIVLMLYREICKILERIKR